MAENLRVAACYTIFNGLELLEKSVEQIYDKVDFIIYCWQEVSNRGNVSTEIVDYINKINDPKIHLLKFEPNERLVQSKKTKILEINKHNLMVQYAKSLGANYFFMSATDHFYRPEDFDYVLNDMVANNYDVSITKMYTYYKHPTWQLDPPENYGMPFLCKLRPETKISNTRYPILIDPSVGVSPCKNVKIYSKDEIMMHHMSMVRVDILSKFTNAAAGINWSDKINKFVDEFENYDININPGVSYFQGRKIKVVNNYFGIN